MHIVLPLNFRDPECVRHLLDAAIDANKMRKQAGEETQMLANAFESALPTPCPALSVLPGGSQTEPSFLWPSPPPTCDKNVVYNLQTHQLLDESRPSQHTKKRATMTLHVVYLATTTTVTTTTAPTVRTRPLIHSCTRLQTSHVALLQTPQH